MLHFFIFFYLKASLIHSKFSGLLSSHSKNAIIILLPANILHFNPHSRIFERRRASISFNWNWSWLNRPILWWFIVWQRLAGRFWCSHNITRDWITESALPCEWIAAILKIVTAISLSHLVENFFHWLQTFLHQLLLDNNAAALQLSFNMSDF